MDIKKLQAIVIDALEDIKATDIVLLDTTRLTSMFDRIVIASGTSNRQTKALAASVRDKVRQAGGTVSAVEGENTGEWVLVDLGDIVVHIMQPPIRAYYQLEEIWGGKSIDLEKARKATRPKPTRSKTAAPKKTDKSAASPKKTALQKKETDKGADKPVRKKAVGKIALSPEKPAAGKKAAKTDAPPKRTVTGKKTSG